VFWWGMTMAEACTVAVKTNNCPSSDSIRISKALEMSRELQWLEECRLSLGGENIRLNKLQAPALYGRMRVRIMRVKSNSEACHNKWGNQYSMRKQETTFYMSIAGPPSSIEQSKTFPASTALDIAMNSYQTFLRNEYLEKNNR